MKQLTRIILVSSLALAAVNGIVATKDTKKGNGNEKD